MGDVTDRDVTVPRGTGAGRCRVLRHGVVVEEPLADVVASLGVDKLIRLRDFEFEHIGPTTRRVVHFNLQTCHHEVGRYYALVRIVTPGRYGPEGEVLPILDVHGAVVGECTRVRKCVAYSELTPGDFVDALGIQSVRALQASILRRYGESLPHMSTDTMLSLGVAVTVLRIVRP